MIRTSKMYGTPLRPKPKHIDPISKDPGAPLVVFEIRGTNGSGKSTLVYQMIKTDPLAETVEYKPDDENSEEIFDFVALKSFDTLVIGEYPLGRAVGGCDRIRGAETIEKHIEHACYVAHGLGLGRILFEGIMTSTSNSRYTRYMVDTLEIPQEDITLLWATTPLDVCIERVGARSGKDFNKDLVVGKFRQLQNQPELHKGLFPNVKRGKLDTMMTPNEVVSQYVEKSFERIY